MVACAPASTLLGLVLALGTPASDGDRALALVAAGHRAADAGRYEAAIEAYTAASAIRPAPKLDYNIGVCHQALVAKTTGAARKAHAKAAAAAYRRYLATTRDPSDRTRVTRIIADLDVLTAKDPVEIPRIDPTNGAAGASPNASSPNGASPNQSSPNQSSPNQSSPNGALPATASPTDPLATSPHTEVSTGDAPSIATSRGSDGSESVSAGAPSSPPTPFMARVAPGSNQTTGHAKASHGRVSPRARLFAHTGVALASPRQVESSSVVEGLPLVGLVLGAGGLVGPSRAWLVAGQLGFHGALELRRERVGLHVGHLGLTVMRTLPLDRRERVFVGLGGHALVAGESLRRRTDTTAIACGLQLHADPSLVSRRLGGIFAGRSELSVRLGRRRRHEVTFGISAGVSVFGRGSRNPMAPGCSEADLAGSRGPFAEAGLPRAVGLFSLFDLGYGLRL